jgi:hypothetical protein
MSLMQLRGGGGVVVVPCFSWEEDYNSLL